MKLRYNTVIILLRENQVLISALRWQSWEVKPRVILCPRVGASDRGLGWCSNSPISSCCVCCYIQKGPGDWHPWSLAPLLNVYHLCRISGSSIRMSWHSSALMWAYHLCCLFPASRNKWGPHDANPDLGSVQVTDVWGG